MEERLVPCDNCGESDDHVCLLDGEEYGPYWTEVEGWETDE